MTVVMKFFLVMLINGSELSLLSCKFDLHLQFPVAIGFTTKSHMVLQ